MTGSWPSRHTPHGSGVPGADVLHDVARAADGVAARGGRAATVFATVSQVALGATAVITAVFALKKLWHKFLYPPPHEPQHADHAHPRHADRHHPRERHARESHGRG